MRLTSLFALVALSSGVSLAEVPAPSPEELRRVITYFYQGKDQGPVLVELKACTKVDSAKTSETRNDCLEEVSGPVKRGTPVYAWTLWMVPSGGQYDDAFVQFLHEGQVRNTIDLNLSTSLRSRAFRASALNKSGKWEIKVARGEQTLSTVSVVVE